MTPDQYFRSAIKTAKDNHDQLSPDQFDNPIDYTYKLAVYNGEVQAYQNSMVEFKKFAKISSEEEATIMMHKFCKDLSDQHRLELAKVENREHQEAESITSERGRLNGLIDGYNNVRIHFDQQTSEHAAERERRLQKKKS